MTIKTEVVCDVCFIVFPKKAPYWNFEPCSIEFNISRPAQTYESFKLDHVCYNCRTDMKTILHSYTQKKLKEVKNEE